MLLSQDQTTADNSPMLRKAIGGLALMPLLCQVMNRGKHSLTGSYTWPDDFRAAICLSKPGQSCLLHQLWLYS